MLELPLINGRFSKTEVADIVAQMVNIKVKFHENKIVHSASEEDIKMRETKIKTLQNALAEFRKQLDQQQDQVVLTANIELG